MFSVHRPFKDWRLLLVTTLLLGFSTLTHSEENAPENTTVQQASPNGSVARAVFTSQIVDREPVDQLTELTNDSERIYFFTDLRGMTGQIVTHQWEYAGNVMAEVKFKVGNGSRWRVYSSKNLLPAWTGKWTVSVIDENGSSLNVSSFTYLSASIPEATTDATTSTE